MAINRTPRNGVALVVFFALLTLGIFASAGAEIYVPSAAFPETGTQGLRSAEGAVLRSDASAVAFPAIELPRLSEIERDLFERQKDKERRIIKGVGRPVPAPYGTGLGADLLEWTTSGKGWQVASFSITSPEASAMRLALSDPVLPEGSEVRFLGSSGKVYGPFRSQDLGSAQKDFGAERALFWSPVIQGDRVVVEIAIPRAANPMDVWLGVPLVSHLLDERNLANIGASDYCQIDVACSPDFTAPSWRNSMESVAKYVFTGANGTSYLCTGELLNDTDPATNIPYFLTANHCAGSAAEAATLRLYWSFQRASCGGANPTQVVDTVGGADLLVTDAAQDFALLRLCASPPPGAGLSGWTNATVAASQAIAGFHHPKGDLKKWNKGLAEGFSPDGGAVDGQGNFVRLHWQAGVTEGGSSGSGIWTAVNGQPFLIGTLSEGASYCTTPAYPDWYSRFDRIYPKIAGWLASGTDNVFLVTLEEPAAGSIASGIGNLRGWAVNSDGIEKIEFYVDGRYVGVIPYGGIRDDVGAAYPQVPGANTSGFSTAYNYGLLRAGQHEVSVRAYGKLGGIKEVASTFTVERFAFEFTQQNPDYSSGSVVLQGSDILLRSVRFENKPYDVLLRWNKASQQYDSVDIAPR